MLRLFVAVDISETAERELSGLIQEFHKKKWKVKWEEPSKLHITLFFLGRVERTKIEDIVMALRKAVVDIEPFSIRMGKLGVFPDYFQPRIVWLGIKGNQKELSRLYKKVSFALESIGFKKERRGWIPHLTIGRVKRSAKFRERKELGRQLKKMETPEFLEETEVDRVMVYESRLKASGSCYYKLDEIFLE